MIGRDDPHGGLLRRRVTGEARAQQRAVPRPRFLGRARRVHADEATAGLDERLQPDLFRVIEDVVGGHHEQHEVDVRERAVGERHRVLAGGQGPLPRGCDGLERCDRGLDRRVAVARGLREHEQAPGRRVGDDRHQARESERSGEGESHGSIVDRWCTHRNARPRCETAGRIATGLAPAPSTCPPASRPTTAVDHPSAP
jgi:hypothetical protein